MRADETTIPLDHLPLMGEWRCRLDPCGDGIADGWYGEELPGRAYLPGTTDSNHLGVPNPHGSRQHLSRLVEYAGAAWYQRTVNVPAAWKQRRLYLFMERCSWESQVWVGETCLGRQNSLSAAHIYDLTGVLQPGPNRLTVRINNAKYSFPRPGSDAADLLLGGGGFHNDASTQTNWNGILGRIELVAKDLLWIESVQVYPQVGEKKARLRLEIGNATGAPVAAQLQAQVRRSGAASLMRDGQGKPLSFQVDLSLGAERLTRMNFDLPLGETAELWDEDHPVLYKVDFSLAGLNGRQVYSDLKSVQFGLRELSQSGTQIAVNGRVTFLRGTLDNAQFPLSGYAPMEKSAWRHIFETAKSYGLNLFRFHSWCPPEAAFAAADEIGFWLHVELAGTSCPSRDELPSLSQFLQAELARILAAYGNHPSFLSLSMGNEQLVEAEPGFLARHQALLMARVRFAQETDPRHLYTCTSHPYTADRSDDFYISAWGKSRANRIVGIEWGGGDVLSQTRFNTHAPETASDYRAGIAGIDRPLITHEVGQWAVYPNLAEIPRYTGLLRARNLERIRASLEQKGLLDQAEAFLHASGRLSQLLYREEIESALRTPGLAGFMLLGLIDQQGQGTSTVGMLDVFWESKGIIAPAAFRQFCGPSTALLRMEKRVWTADETFSARLELAHYAGQDVPAACPVWSVRDGAGTVYAAGELPARAVRAGELAELGEIRFELADLPAPAQLSVRAGLPGAALSEWEIWVYPAALANPAESSVLIAAEWNDAIRTALDAGGSVLLLPRLESLPRAIPGCFTPVFWNTLMKKDQLAKTMGLLCEPAHPAFRQFPTDFHSNWQWWDLMMNSRTLVLDSLPASFRPLLQVIDTFEYNRRLGAVFQARVGKGRLLVSAIDLSSDLAVRPAARQLRFSLLAYMNSAEFQPVHELDFGALDELFRQAGL